MVSVPGQGLRAIGDAGRQRLRLPHVDRDAGVEAQRGAVGLKQRQAGRAEPGERLAQARPRARGLEVGGEPAGGVAPGQAARVEGQQGDEAPGALRQ